MKRTQEKRVSKIAMFNALIAVLLVASSFVCVSAKSKTKRVDANEVIDLDGYWNDTDVRLVCEDLIKQCVSSPRVAKFEGQYGRVPTVVLGSIKNDSTEHIDTSIVAKRFQNAIINNGALDFVADATERAELMGEADYQEQHALDYSNDEEGEEVSKIDKAQSADFILLGSVKSMVQKEGKLSARTYFVYAQLMDVKKHTIVWSGENSEIKKVIKRQKAK